MKQLYPDLWISKPDFPNKTEEPTLMMHGFLLRHPKGNLLISRIEADSDIETIKGFGGATRHYITHWHEASASINKIRLKLKSQFWCHELAAPEVSLFAIPDKTFSEDVFHFEDFQIIHTPGHTPACSSYLIEGHLFTGDALFMPDSGTGRCDFPKGSSKDLYHSIAHKLYQLPDHTKIYVGHDYQPQGRSLLFTTTLLEEKKSNIQLRSETTESDFIQFRSNRDKQLSAPKLLFPSIQVNIDGGKLPDAEKNGQRYLKIPLFNS